MWNFDPDALRSYGAGDHDEGWQEGAEAGPPGSQVTSWAHTDEAASSVPTDSADLTRRLSNLRLATSSRVGASMRFPSAFVQRDDLFHSMRHRNVSVLRADAPPPEGTDEQYAMPEHTIQRVDHDAWHPDTDEPTARPRRGRGMLARAGRMLGRVLRAGRSTTNARADDMPPSTSHENSRERFGQWQTNVGAQAGHADSGGFPGSSAGSWAPPADSEELFHRWLASGEGITPAAAADLPRAQAEFMRVPPPIVDNLASGSHARPTARATEPAEFEAQSIYLPAHLSAASPAHTAQLAPAQAVHWHHNRMADLALMGLFREYVAVLGINVKGKAKAGSAALYRFATHIAQNDPADSLAAFLDRYTTPTLFGHAQSQLAAHLHAQSLNGRTGDEHVLREALDLLADCPAADRASATAPEGWCDMELHPHHVKYPLPPQDATLLESAPPKHVTVLIRFAFDLLRAGIGGLTEWLAMSNDERHVQARQLMVDHRGRHPRVGSDVSLHVALDALQERAGIPHERRVRLAGKLVFIGEARPLPAVQHPVMAEPPRSAPRTDEATLTRLRQIARGPRTGKYVDAARAFGTVLRESDPHDTLLAFMARYESQDDPIRNQARQQLRAFQESNAAGSADIFPALELLLRLPANERAVESAVDLPPRQQLKLLSPEDQRLLAALRTNASAPTLSEHQLEQHQRAATRFATSLVEQHGSSLSGWLDMYHQGQAITAKQWLDDYMVAADWEASRYLPPALRRLQARHGTEQPDAILRAARYDKPKAKYPDGFPKKEARLIEQALGSASLSGRTRENYQAALIGFSNALRRQRSSRGEGLSLQYVLDLERSGEREIIERLRNEHIANLLPPERATVKRALSAFLKSAWQSQPAPPEQRAESPAFAPQDGWPGEDGSSSGFGWHEAYGVPAFERPNSEAEFYDALAGAPAPAQPQPQPAGSEAIYGDLSSLNSAAHYQFDLNAPAQAHGQQGWPEPQPQPQPASSDAFFSDLSSLNSAAHYQFDLNAPSQAHGRQGWPAPQPEPAPASDSFFNDLSSLNSAAHYRLDLNAPAQAHGQQGSPERQPEPAASDSFFNDLSSLNSAGNYLFGQPQKPEPQPEPAASGSFFGDLSAQNAPAPWYPYPHGDVSTSTRPTARQNPPPEIIDVDNLPSHEPAIVGVAQRLVGNAWLRDDDLGNYTRMLAAQFQGQPNAHLLEFVDSMAIQSLLTGGRRQRNAVLGRLTGPNAPPILFVPVNHNDTHWSLLVIDRMRNRSFHYDSSVPPYDAYSANWTEQFGAATQVTSALGAPAPIGMPTAMQHDAHSCGDHVLTGIEVLAHRVVSGQFFNQDGMDLTHIQPNREHIVRVLAQVEAFDADVRHRG